MNNAYNRFAQMMQPQEVGGISPVFQNLAQQQALQNAAMQQGIGLTNQAGMTVKGQQAGAGMNPMMMAQMLRNSQTNPYINAQRAMQQYGAGNVYGYGGMGQVPTTTTGMD